MKTIFSKTIFSKKIVSKTITILSLVCLSQAAIAQSKVAFVSTDRILKESVAAKEAQKSLELEFSKREAALNDMAGDIKKKSDRLERDAATMPAAERSKLQSELQTADLIFQRERRNTEEEIQARRNSLLSAILERANREVVRIAEAEKIDIVLQEVVWASPKIDITPRVLEALKK